MKTNRKSKSAKLNTLTIVFILFMGNVLLFGQGKTKSDTYYPEDKTSSPYFFVKSDTPEIDRLPLKQTNVDVNVVGVIADIVITQVYENEGNKALEAIYVFPASTRAAVYAMKMKIGEREIVAIVQEKDKARRNYEQAKANGQTASLLEQERPNVFTMSVANILPGDIIEVELKYTEMLIPVEGIYEFVFPTVVGPRYNSNGENHKPENWIANPYLKEGNDPNFAFNIHVNIATGIPLQSLQCPSHDVEISYKGRKNAAISLRNASVFQGNKDFILDYRLAGKQIETGLLLYEGVEENFFLAMIQPPERITEETITPREYIFIVDVSGSMHGFPLNVSKKLMRNLIGDLKPKERFNILLFAGGSNLFSEKSVAANEENISRAIAFIDKQSGGGGTELLPALKRAMSLPIPDNFSRSFVIATDGYVSVERETFEYMNKNLGKANFFTFGIGSSVNRYLIEGMAHVGKAESFVVTEEKEASAVANKFRKYISKPVLTSIELRFEGFDAYDVEPLSVPDVLAERPVIIYGKWRGKTKGRILLTGFGGNEEFINLLNVENAKSDKNNSALKYLWAREKIRMLDDFAQVSSSDQELKDEITSLGLKYKLLTRFTSFLALDSEMRNSDGSLTKVNQPLPLPEGVSNYAVGGTMKHSAVRIRGTSATISQAPKFAKNYTLDEMEEDRVAVQETIEHVSLPEYQDGIEKLKKFLQDNLKYPESMKTNNLSGVVYVSIIVDIDGSIVQMSILRGLHPEADKEALRVLKMTNKMWKPGERNGTKVAAEIIISVKFSLN